MSLAMDLERTKRDYALFRQAADNYRSNPSRYDYVLFNCWNEEEAAYYKTQMNLLYPDVPVQTIATTTVAHQRLGE